LTSISLALLATTTAGSLLSMVAFAVLRRGYRDADAARKGARFMLGSGDFLVNWLMWALGPLERGLLRAGAGPDLANVAGLVFGALAGVLIGLGQLEAGGWAIALAGVSDVMDGRLARARGVASPYGMFVDSTLDRFVETFAFLGFAVYFRGWAFGSLIVAAGLGGSLLVSYAQARGEAVNVRGAGGLMQRAERLVLTLLGCLFDPVLSHALGRPQGSVLLVVLILIAVGAFGTAVYRTLWIARQLRV
jgi:CDP-diacylglycerol--glycerol-3-phosphate 3-phosphatidyltransferase